MRANSEIDALVSALLDSGVSPKYVSRLASELGDHFTDLEAEARRFGVPPDEASADAKRRLGACSAIAEEFVSRPELRSWKYRSAWLRCVLRVLVAAYLAATTPLRAVAAANGVMLRYTAAAACGTGVTLAMLLVMTLLLSPEFAWGVRIMNGAGTALGHELDLPARRSAPGSASGPASGPPDTPLPGGSTEAAGPDAAAFGVDAPVGDRSGRHALAGATNDRLYGMAPALSAGAEPVLAKPARRPDWRAGEPFWTSRSMNAAVPPFDAPEPRAVVTMLQPAPPDTLTTVDPEALSPIVGTAPSYPVSAARRGIEGYVVVEYTVTREGEVREVVVLETSSQLFNRAALEAAKGLRYRPRTIGGHAVDVVGVRTVIRFELDV